MIEISKCPYCGNRITQKEYDKIIERIDLEKKEAIEKTREELKEKLKQKEKALKFKELKIKEEAKKRLRSLEKQTRERLEKRFAQQIKEVKETKVRLVDERRKIREEKKKLKKTLEHQIEGKFSRKYEKERAKLENRGRELEKSEDELKRREKRIEDTLKQEYKIKFENALAKEKTKIERERSELQEKKFNLKEEKAEIKKLYEKRKQKLEKTIEDLKREAERKSLIELGEIPEEQLLDALRLEFPLDSFERVKRGRKGGDVIQSVTYGNNACAKILYESKHTKTWSGLWLDKIKKDALEVDASYCILVTKAFPSKIKHFGIVNRVLVVSPRLLTNIASIVRGSIIAIEKQRLSATEKEKKTNSLYIYLNSDSFKTGVRTVGESIKKLNEIREKERATHENVWTKEELEVKNIARQSSKIYANIGYILEKEEKPIATVIRIRKKKKQPIEE